MMKSWKIACSDAMESSSPEEILALLLTNRGITDETARKLFLEPPRPGKLTADDVGVNPENLETAISRIQLGIRNGESIVVYADYDADGVTSGAIMWEAVHALGGKIMPYIPHRVDEGYGLSVKGIDTVIAEYNPTLIITVDHGITCREQVEYAKGKGIEVIVTDHHVKPELVPDATTVHTTTLCGAGIAWMVAKELFGVGKRKKRTSVDEAAEKNVDRERLSKLLDDLLALAAIGTVSDMVPLVGPNRSIAKYGLESLNTTKRVGLEAIMNEAGLVKGTITATDISHVIAPRLNAMGRLEHALDALRLICTRQEDRAAELASHLGSTNHDRQQLTVDSTLHALGVVEGSGFDRVIVVADESYNQGVIGLVAGKLVERHFRPSIVIAKSEGISKASARSIPGFNIIEALRECSDLLLEVGGHPMAAGFSIETGNIEALKDRLNKLALERLNEDQLVRSLPIDCILPLPAVTRKLWETLGGFAPFGMGNPEPVFATMNTKILDARTVGATGKHLKLKVGSPDGLVALDAIAFGFGEMYPDLKPGVAVDVAYTVDMNEWNGRSILQLKLRDIRIP